MDSNLVLEKQHTCLIALYFLRQKSISANDFIVFAEMIYFASEPLMSSNILTTVPSLNWTRFLGDSNGQEGPPRGCPRLATVPDLLLITEAKS